MSDRRMWRVGTHFPIHVYAEHPTEGRDHDEPVCTALTTAFARQIVADHNRAILAGESDV